MALQSSGAISLNEIHVEAGGSSGSQAALNDTDIRGLISKSSGAQMSFSEWYGASSGPSLHYFDVANATFGSERNLAQLQPSGVGSAQNMHWMRLDQYEDDAQHVDFSHDGTKMFVKGFPATASSEMSIYRYDMSTAWDITTAVGQTGLSGTVQNGYRIPRTISGSTHTWGGYLTYEAFKFFDSGNKILISYMISGGRAGLIYGSMTTAYDLSTATYSRMGFNIQYMEQGFGIQVSPDLKTIMFTGNDNSSSSPYGRYVKFQSSSANQFSSGSSAYSTQIYDLKHTSGSSTNASKTLIIGGGVDLSSTSTHAGGTIITGYHFSHSQRFIYRLDNSFTHNNSAGTFNTLTPTESSAYKSIRSIMIKSDGTKGLAAVGPTTNLSGTPSTTVKRAQFWPKRIVNLTW